MRVTFKNSGMSAPASPVIISTRGDYDLSALPPEAFAADDGERMEEPEVVPKVLAMTLRQTNVVNDAESDSNFGGVVPKDSAISQFAKLVGPGCVKALESRVPRVKIGALNEVQSKLEEMEDLSEWVDPVFRGLEKTPGFSQANSDVNRLMIDIFRHVFVKSSENVRKASLAVIIPFLVEKLSDRKLKHSITELMLMIAEGVCPSFVVVQVSEFLSGIKGNKIPAPKTTSTALEICVECIRLFGIGDIAIDEYIPILLKLLEFKTADVKAQASIIACYIYRVFGEPFKSFLDVLPDSVKQRLFSEFENVIDLPSPTKSYLRQKSAARKPAALQAKQVQSPKFSHYITSNQIQEAEFSKKWTEQRDFLANVETAFAECKDPINSEDLDAIMRVLKKYLGENNKNLVLKSLVVLEQVLKASDKEIKKYASLFAPSLIAAWGDNRSNIRDQATKVIDAFVVFSTPSPFIRVFGASSFKSNNDSRPEIMRFLVTHIREIHHSDLERPLPLLMQCLEDRVGSTRQLAMQVAGYVRKAVPDAFESQLLRLTPASQRTIRGYFETEPAPQLQQQQKSAAPVKEVEQPRISRRTQKVEQPVQELPRYVSTPTDAKKQKRLKQQTENLGLAMVNNKQVTASVLEKVKSDAQGLLPTSVSQKLFSTMVADQNEGLQEMRQLYSDDPTLVVWCSDLFVRWLAVRMFEKNVKIIAEGIKFLMDIFSETNVSKQEIETLVPVVFWCVDSKSGDVSDTVLDLLFLIRIHSEPHDYLQVLTDCLETCSAPSLVHLFTELQYTVTDDTPKADVFSQIVGYISHKSIAVAAACGGVLSMLARRMTTDEKEQLISSLPDAQRQSLSAIVSIEPREPINFKSFVSMQPLDKIRSCKKLIEQLKTNAAMVESSSEAILYGLLHELSAHQTDWPVIKLVIISLHSILVSCSIRGQDLKETLLSLTFFANRWQRKLVLMEGIPQAINAILFKIFEKIPLLHIFTTLLEGMSSITGTIPTESFYCKCWVAATNQLNELIHTGDAPKIISMATEQLQNLPSDDVRYKLLSALVLTLQGKKPKPPTPRRRESPITTDPAPKPEPPAAKPSKSKQTPSEPQQQRNQQVISDLTKRLNILKRRWT